jgi:hypothetical protein
MIQIKLYTLFKKNIYSLKNIYIYIEKMASVQTFKGSIKEAQDEVVAAKDPDYLLSQAYLTSLFQKITTKKEKLAELMKGKEYIEILDLEDEIKILEAEGGEKAEAARRKFGPHFEKLDVLSATLQKDLAVPALNTPCTLRGQCRCPRPADRRAGNNVPCPTCNLSDYKEAKRAQDHTTKMELICSKTSSPGPRDRYGVGKGDYRFRHLDNPGDPKYDTLITGNFGTREIDQGEDQDPRYVTNKHHHLEWDSMSDDLKKAIKKNTYYSDFEQGSFYDAGLKLGRELAIKEYEEGVQPGEEGDERHPGVPITVSERDRYLVTSDRGAPFTGRMGNNPDEMAGKLKKALMEKIYRKDGTAAAFVDTLGSKVGQGFFEGDREDKMAKMAKSAELYDAQSEYFQEQADELMAENTLEELKEKVGDAELVDKIATFETDEENAAALVSYLNQLGVEFDEPTKTWVDKPIMYPPREDHPQYPRRKQGITDEMKEGWDPETNTFGKPILEKWLQDYDLDSLKEYAEKQGISPDVISNTIDGAGSGDKEKTEAMIKLIINPPVELPPETPEVEVDEGEDEEDGFGGGGRRKRKTKKKRKYSKKKKKSRRRRSKRRSKRSR